MLKQETETSANFALPNRLDIQFNFIILYNVFRFVDYREVKLFKCVFFPFAIIDLYKKHVANACELTKKMLLLNFKRVVNTILRIFFSKSQRFHSNICNINLICWFKPTEWETRERRRIVRSEKIDSHIANIESILCMSDDAFQMMMINYVQMTDGFE